MVRIDGLTDAEWLARRSLSIGASEAAAVLGIDTFKSAFQVYAEKLGILSPVEDNEAMRQGRDLEPYVAQRFSERTGKSVIPNGKVVFVADNMPWISATPDYWIYGENAGLECKTIGERAQADLDAGEIPQRYYVQCVQSMAVTGADRWYLAILQLGRGFYDFLIRRDELEIIALTTALSNFWHDCVEAKIPPTLTGTTADTDAVARIVSPARLKTDALPMYEHGPLVCEIVSIDRQIKALEKERDARIQTVKATMRSAEVAVTANHYITWKQTKRGRTFRIKERNND